ncbi:expressed unknown protein [Ectocarpus siliculosus]|uniref:Uncharacterized protein n=1 Tax=Ectocarpus siliculosus TaxID=2880 RepID=D8LTN6_ECTSI|nr:expressed unknown protein [Ectocarpus siliculosus]|eukprot:CBN73933.1 expressed unknown protein [Ectocarpus siliculosus]
MRPTLALLSALLASLVHFPRAERVLLFRGGGPSGSPPSKTRATGSRGLSDDDDPPPIREVVGAGAVGVLAGQLVFQSLLISAGLGVTAMTIAASSADGAGDIARSSGRMAVAAFDRGADLNERYHFTERLVNGAKITGWRLKQFDQEHAVVHRATDGAKKAWRDFKQYDEAHGLTSRAGEAMTSGLDKLAEALTPPPSSKPGGRRNSSSTSRSRSQNNSIGNNANDAARTDRGKSGYGTGKTGTGRDKLGRGFWKEAFEKGEGWRSGLWGAEDDGGRWRTKKRDGGGGGSKRVRQERQRSRDDRDEQWWNMPIWSGVDDGRE